MKDMVYAKSFDYFWIVDDLEHVLGEELDTRTWSV